MSRTARVLEFDLSVTRPAGTPEWRDTGGARYLFVDRYDGAPNAVLLGFDNGAVQETVRAGRKWVACDGGDYQRVGLVNSPTSGLLRILVSGEDSVPFESAGMASVPVPDVDLSWPPLSAVIGQSTAFVQNCNARLQYPNVAAATFLLFGPANNLGGGFTVNMGRSHGNEVIVGQAVRANIPMVGFPVWGPLTVRSWPAGSRMPKGMRVWQLPFSLACAGGNPTEQTGLEFVVSAAAAGGWVTQLGNAGAIGIVGNGAGGWQFVAKLGVAAAGWSVQVPIVTGYPITELTSFLAQFIMADGGGPAQFSLLVDGVPLTLPAAARTWAAGSLLPTYANGTLANSNKFLAQVQENDGLTLQFGPMNPMAGRYTFDGAERT